MTKKYSFADAHCDTLTETLLQNKNLFKNDLHINIQKFLEFENPVQVFSIWLSKENVGKYYENTVKNIDFFYNQINKYNEYIDCAKSYEDIIKNRNNNKITGILGIEGGEAFEGKLDNIKKLYDLGVRVVTLTWNYKNELGSGRESDLGLTDFGRKAIIEMNKLGILVDVSHLNESCFWEVYKLTDKPFIASHSNSYKIHEVKRNLKDEQIKAIADKNGVIGINLYPKFISNAEDSTIDMLLKHIEHMLNLVGEDYIALGCDFDGVDNLPKNIEDVTSLNNLFDLFTEKFGKDITEKIIFSNLMKVFSEIFQN